MKIRWLAFLWLIFMAAPAVADNQIFLVRHAEKALDQGRDPDLTEQGKARANRIAALLANSGISKIYSTNYKRTLHTAMPLAQKLGIEVELYDPRVLPSFAKTLSELEGKILVVGHSNTTPQLTSLLLQKPVPLMTEKEYNHLYLVTTLGGKTELLEFSTD